MEKKKNTQCGIIFNRHKWGEWSEVERGDIDRVTEFGQDKIVGKYIHLERKCTKCGDIQFNLKKIYNS